MLWTTFHSEMLRICLHAVDNLSFGYAQDMLICCRKSFFIQICLYAFSFRYAYMLFHSDMLRICMYAVDKFSVGYA